MKKIIREGVYYVLGGILGALVLVLIFLSWFWWHRLMHNYM